MIFGRFFSFSGAFHIWFDFLEKDIDQTEFNFEYCYMDIGGHDVGRIFSNRQFSLGTEEVYTKLINHGFCENQIHYQIFPADDHSNLCFGRRFQDVLRWVFQDCEKA